MRGIIKKAEKEKERQKRDLMKQKKITGILTVKIKIKNHAPGINAAETTLLAMKMSHIEVGIKTKRNTAAMNH